MLFIPLDSRPVSTSLPAMMALAAGAKLLAPRAELAGGLDSGADTEALMRWLEAKFRSGADALFLSVDALVFGGLVQSRERGTDIGAALKTLERLAALKRKVPDVPILAFQSVLRDALTVRDEQTLADWKKMMRGDWYPDWYAALRERNLEVARRMIELTADGTIDTLVLSKEDTSPRSPFLSELDELRAFIEKRGAAGRAFVTTGADEVILLLMARFLCSGAALTPKFRFISADPLWRDRVPPYEHQGFGTTVAEQIRALGGEIVGDEAPDAIDVVVHFHAETQDVFLRQLKGVKRQPSDSAAVEKTAALVAHGLESGRRTALLDCAMSNGADAELLKRLAANGDFFRLFSWAAWNTHANRSGNLLAHCAAALAGAARPGAKRAKRLKKHVHYMLDRAAHDCVYSTLVRGKLTGYADRAGMIVEHESALEALADAMAEKTAGLFHPLDRTLDGPPGAGAFVLHGISVEACRFPWDRLFEISLSAEPSISTIKMAD